MTKLEELKEVIETIELELWENIKNDMGYPEEDNNNGYIYGINFLDETGVDIEDVQWFKTPEERHEMIKSFNNCIITNITNITN